MEILGIEQFNNGDCTGMITFNDEERHLYDECKRWRKLIDTYFSTSYDCYKLSKIGRFEGIRPHIVYRQSVSFQISEYSEPSWKDWFDVTGKDDGDLIGVVGKVINERTFKHYAS
jgi:hypothetical protein